MPNIKPVSDLREYSKVLDDIAVGEPVYLTKNGRGKYVIADIVEYEKLKATVKLLSKLAEGEKSGRQEGWMSFEQMADELGLDNV
ncbi:MAG: type II toxin-antitoxin system prevent-host-death family antitoxin [Oscillospiraceae bacterium]|nr:type II toxin-antitoxin system prevent-host-death family antitoxin [Oscillospiraceae bacterium]